MRVFVFCLRRGAGGVGVVCHCVFPIFLCCSVGSGFFLVGVVGVLSSCWWWFVVVPFCFVVVVFDSWCASVGSGFFVVCVVGVVCSPLLVFRCVSGSLLFSV